MSDAEVLRLRKLRNAALRARALAKSLDSNSTSGESVFARSGVTCWTIARVASGCLRAHPYLSYQRGPSALRNLADRVIAASLALYARGRSSSVFAQQLQVVAREVDDVRALTWSPDLSDALGRMQIQIRRLARELGLNAIGETGAVTATRAIVAPADTRNSLAEISGDNAWPYLAI
jgi:hypothetical protein